MQDACSTCTPVSYTHLDVYKRQTRALKIVKTNCTLRENANWQNDVIKEIYKQANSGGVLLSSMGNPKPLPVFWDNILMNASQVTNPSIDPLREPMETRVYLGKKPEKIKRLDVYKRQLLSSSNPYISPLQTA